MKITYEELVNLATLPNVKVEITLQVNIDDDDEKELSDGIGMTGLIPENKDVKGE